MVGMVLQLVIAFVLASLLNIRKLRLRKLYKTLLMFPWAMPGYVSILLWKTGMFNSQFGLLNQWMQALGQEAVRWLSSDASAFLCCTAVNLWLALPFMLMIMDGALRSIDRSYCESAMLDGAGWLQRTFSITIPAIRPIIAPAVIITVFTTFKQFDVVYLLTQAAGVSISTVSKVINGHYSISQATAQRVRQVMHELKYYPSASAQSFARGATHTVTVLANLSANTAFRNPHMFEILSGLEESLRAKGYRLVLRGVDETTAYEAAEEIISRRSGDALAIHVSVITHPLAALLTRLRFPHIVLGAPSFESQVCWIDNNNVYSGSMGADFLVSAGYRKIAFVGGQYYDLGSSNRLQGVKQTLQDAGIPLENRFIWLGESTRADGHRMTRQLMEARERPEAIVCANNYIALGCVDALKDMGCRIPEDIGVIAFDDYPFSGMIEPPLTVVDISVRDLGLQAGKFLSQIIRHPNMQVQTYVTTSNLIIRNSTRQKP